MFPFVFIRPAVYTPNQRPLKASGAMQAPSAPLAARKPRVPHALRVMPPLTLTLDVSSPPAQSNVLEGASGWYALLMGPVVSSSTNGGISELPNRKRMTLVATVVVVGTL